MCSFLHVGNVLFGTDLSSVSLAAGRRSKTPRNRTEVFCPTTGFKKKSSCLIFLLLRYDYTWSTLYISLYLIPDIHVTMFVEANKKHTFLHFMLFTVNVSCNSLTFNSVSHIQQNWPPANHSVIRCEWWLWLCFLLQVVTREGWTLVAQWRDRGFPWQQECPAPFLITWGPTLLHPPDR